MLQSAGMYNTYAVSMQSDTRTNERLANGDISGACEYCTEARKRRWRKEHHKPDWKWLPILHTMDECKSLVSRLYNNDCMNACSFCFGKRLMDIKLGSTVEPITHELRFCRRMQQVYMKGGTTAGTEDGGGDDTGSGENEDSLQQSKSGVGASGPSQGPQKLTANAPAWPPHPSHNRGETELIDMMQRSSINGNNQTRRNYGEREHEEPYGRGGGRGGREREVVEMVESNMQGVMSTTIQVIEEPILTATPTTVAPTTVRLLFTVGLCMNVKASFQLSISSVLLT